MTRAPTTPTTPAAAVSWVGDRYGVELRPGDSPTGWEVTDLVGVGLRQNPRRAHLLVSTVLGKHVPTDPRIVLAAGRLLGSLVGAAFGGRVVTVPEADLLRAALRGEPGSARQLLGSVPVAEPAPAGTVVLGYAETATGLGHAVAEALPGCYYLHSTRREVPGVSPAAAFEEEHSHATGHLLLPEEPAALGRPGPVVLVDDELSTGRTALNTIRVLHRLRPRARYVVAALVDLRWPGDRAALAAVAAELGTRIDVVSLSTGSVVLPADLPARVADDDGAAPLRPNTAAPARGTGAEVRTLSGWWPKGLREGGRHGYRGADRAALERQVGRLAERLRGATTGRVLVLGTEELLYAPLRLAVALAERSADEVRFSSTTRSPAIAVDEPGYPLRTQLAFPASDGPGERYAYNVAGAGFDTVVVVTDATDPGALVHALAGCCERLLVLPVPAYHPRPLPEPLRGPEFGSYPAEDVGWLLTDLSGVSLEAPTEEREEAIQAGGRHYAESLPVEYVPTVGYREGYERALTSSARRVAEAVGTVTEQVLAAREGRPVLVSLARAGIPVGILMRRWAGEVHGLDVPHYAVSIVRGRGIDPVALRWLAAQYDPARVMFVDGWTGKGAIVRELQAAVAEHAAWSGQSFPTDLAVLADPGECLWLFGTREDFLVPSACLNSTVSGLVSRTVLNEELTGPGQFHGAKFYAALAEVDVSAEFLAAVTGQFPMVRAAVAARDTSIGAEPTWRGWTAVEEISAAYGIGDVTLVKPGVGETTRVLLRRVPWRILARSGAGADIAHVVLLAAERGVPVEYVDDLPYACVGLIHPRYTRGATGAGGTSARGEPAGIRP
ncbi:MAG: phosphoribosyltransferase [Geodermatophilaceae bacterium]